MLLESLLERGEGKTLEFKREITQADSAVKTVVAFANTSGGILVIGVEDKTKRVHGVSDPLGVEERLANIIVPEFNVEVPHIAG